MTLIASMLQKDIDDLTQRRTSLKKRWIDKQRTISDLLVSAVAVCRTSANDVHLHTQEQEQQQELISDTLDDLEFERSLIDYLTKHAPISIASIAQNFSKDEEQINNLLKKLKVKLDCSGKTVLSVNQLDDSLLSNVIKPSSSPIKRSFPSWMGLPPRHRALLPHEHPPRQLIQLLSHLSARELERENFNVQMDQLLNRQTAMEKMLSRRFRTHDTIQEYCQYTTRDECPLASPHGRHYSRSPSASSDNEQETNDEDDISVKKKRKRDDSTDLGEQTKHASRYRKNGRNIGTCGKVHFRRLIKSHTDRALGDCSFLNTCFHMVGGNFQVN